jgi:hypothetical protein
VVLGVHGSTGGTGSGSGDRDLGFGRFFGETLGAKTKHENDTHKGNVGHRHRATASVLGPQPAAGAIAIATAAMSQIAQPAAVLLLLCACAAHHRRAASARAWCSAQFRSTAGGLDPGAMRLFSLAFPLFSLALEG